MPPGAPPYQGALHPGDRVRVVRHDGSALELFVTEVREDAIAGELDLRERDVRGAAVPPVVVVPLVDVARVERVGFSPGRTIAFAGVVTWLAVIYAGLLYWQHEWEKKWGADPHGAAAPAPAR